MQLAIIKSGGANFLSVTTAFEHLGVSYVLTNDAATIQNADAVILPGVGSAGYAMEKLKEDNLISVIKNLTQPVLGICLGMQLLYEFSEEDNIACLGIIEGRVRKFSTAGNLIVPHMGWNNLQIKTPDPVVSNVDLADVYFVHSYYAPLNDATIASCNYSLEFTAIAKHNNFYAMQFHPEKSGDMGSKLLKNFINLIK